MMRNLILRAKASFVDRLRLRRRVERQNLEASVPQFDDPSRYVHSLYKVAFGRYAEPDGLASRIRQLQSGFSLERLAGELVASDEFRARHGSSQIVDLDYVKALYHDGLEREPDPEGLANWLAAGANGATRTKVLVAFATSKEVLEKAGAFSTILAEIDDVAVLVNSFYRSAFGRLAEPEGLTHRISQLHSGMSPEILAEELVGSVEFQIRHGKSQIIDTKFITALYRDGLGRQPNLKNLAFWLAEGNNGKRRAQVLAAIAGSKEALERDHRSKLDGRAAYSRWVTLNDTISEADRLAIRAHIAGLPFHPVISIIMSNGTKSETGFRESFSSVISQLYPYWELCIAVDTAMEPLLNTILPGRNTIDPRFRVVGTRSPVENGVAAMNAALKLATGEFVAFLRTGDTLAEHALYEMAVELGASSCADIIYSDQDQLDDNGQRIDPWFKPGWDPDFLLAQDYINDLAVYRRKLIEQIGSVRHNFEGAELHDLVLRSTAETCSDRIRHVPAILYHKRCENMAINSEQALVTLRAIAGSRRAVREHLNSQGIINALLKPAPQIPSATRVVWHVSENPPLVSVIIPTHDRSDLLEQCVEGVLHCTDYPNLELLIIDNGSVQTATHTLFDQLTHDDSRIRILRHPGPFNYSAMNNAAAREANGEILLLLNNDISVIDSGWLRELVSHALRPDVGIVGAKLLYPSGQVQHAGVALGPEGNTTHLYRLARSNDAGHFGELALPRTLSAVTGACAAIRRDVFFEVGAFDEVNLPVAYNDVDLCLRLGDYGYRVVWTPFAELFHLESASRGPDVDDPVKRERSLREWQYIRNTWGSLMESADPFHNPNLHSHPDYHEIPSSPRRLKPWHYIAEQVSNLNRCLLPMENGFVHI